MADLASIRAARERIGGAVVRTPCVQSQALAELTGCPTALKLENLQMTGSFKERGALNRILLLSEEERKRGLITASAGNHGQAVAYHATSRGVRARIVMPEATPLIKVSSTKRYGGEIVLHGSSFDEAYREARRQCDAEGLYFLHGFDDEAVIAGQGTVGLEILEQSQDVEAVVVPIGGGGLIAGIACAIKELKPGVRLIGVQTARVPSMQAALEAHHPVTLDAARTIADGIAVRTAGTLTLPMVEKYVDEIVTVEEEEIAKAILLLLEREKTVAEGAGAAGLAALLNRKTDLAGKRTVVVIGGGNIDVIVLARIIERGLVQDNRLMRLRIYISDRPGGLHQLTGILASQRANIVEIQHERAYYGVNLGDTTVEITLETRGPEHIDEIVAELKRRGYPYDRVL